MRIPFRTLITLLCVLSVTGTAPASDFDAELLDAMTWRSIGPARGGRVTTVCGVPGEPLVYYMGATGGGVWKTTNGGIGWRPISDDAFGTGSIGAIAVAGSDPNVIYVGTGERDPRGNFSHGDGMYKSVDAGENWTHVGLRDSRHIAKIRVHPADADVVYTAVLGHIFGPNDERGVYRSHDGGASWERILFVDEDTGAIDLAMDPVNPRILYAAFWQVRRSPWSLDSGGPGSGLYKSTDGGDTWTELTSGLPKGVKGKIGVAVSPVDHDRVWAIVEAENGGVYRSDNGGDSFRRINDDRSLRQRAWYYTHIIADTESVDTVYVMNVSFHKSTDGGATYDSIRVPHSDNHDLWINPDDSRIMVNGNDGGANVSFDGGASWSRQDNQATAQFYHVITDDQFPYRVYGAQQDNSTVSISSQSRGWGRPDFYSVGGGESGYIAPVPGDPNIVYAGSYGGFLTRYDHATRSSRNITVWPENPMGAGVVEMKYRFQWTFPIVVSKHDPSVVYTAGNVVFKSTNEGQSWKIISPDLTTDDELKQQSSGGPITQDNTSVEYYCTIFALAESPHDADVLWAGSDDGRVHVTRDGGSDWQDVTPVGLGAWSRISQIDPSPHDPATAYLAVNRYHTDDFAPYIFVTNDYGRTWRRIDRGIDSEAFVRAVREDPVRRGLLFAGTETGVWVSLDDGANWHDFQFNLPRCPITDLVIHDNDVVVATQGRSFWILGDITPLRHFDAASEEAIQLYEPAPVYRVGWDAARIHYMLAEESEEPIVLEFLDEDGAVIRIYGGDDGDDPKPSADAGLNRYTWNLRYPDAEDVPGAVMWTGNARGPAAVPGTYRVRLTHGDTVLEETLEVRGDPRFDTSDADYRAQFDFTLRVRETVTKAHEAVNRIRTVRAQINDVLAHADGHESHQDLGETAKPILDTLKAIEEEIIQTRSKSRQDPLNYPIKLNDKTAALSGIARGPYPPTDQAVAVLDDLTARLDEQLTKLNAVEMIDIPEFNRAVRSADVPAVRAAEGEDG